MQSRNRKQNFDRTNRAGFPRPLTFLLCAGLALGCGGSGGGQTAENPPPAQNLQVTLVEAGTGFALPVQVTHAGDGSGRVFVVEQAGTIRTLDNSAAPPFLDIRDRVLSGGEQGLLGLAFPPGYATKRYFYVYYTRPPDNNVVARFRSTANPDAADPNSEEILLAVPQPFSNHNGGQLAFGPDGFLYIGKGDGGGGGDTDNNAQNPASLLGKILRIDVESVSDPGLLYAIPPTNPFTQTTSVRREIWALGLRNPWRFSFDRQTGDLYIGDVGQGQFEEIDFQPSASPGGENYGWNVMEGAHCFPGPSCNNAGLVFPVAEYDHGQGCSVTGGMVYRGAEFPSFQGTYVYGDFCSGRIWGLRKAGTAWENTLLADTTHQISAFGEDEAGNLYAAAYGTGTVYRIAPM